MTHPKNIIKKKKSVVKIIIIDLKLTLAPRKRASSNSCFRGSNAAWKCSILTAAPKKQIFEIKIIFF